MLSKYNKYKHRIGWLAAIEWSVKASNEPVEVAMWQILEQGFTSLDLIAWARHKGFVATANHEREIVVIEKVGSNCDPKTVITTKEPSNE